MGMAMLGEAAERRDREHRDKGEAAGANITSFDVEKHHDTNDGSNFKVVLRVRPPLPRELNGDRNFEQICRFQGSDSVTVSENLAALDDPKEAGNFSSYSFTFDHVYAEDSNQLSVYNNTARDAVLSTLGGYNATIIAYGQTGTGKTYTMEGEPEPRTRGIIPRATEEMFGYIEAQACDRKKFLVRASYLQIYNEVISDLLKPERTNLHVREDKKRGVFVEGLSEWVVRSPKEVYGLMQRGAMTRCTANTKMNEISSRSHAVFIIILEQLEYLDDAQASSAASGHLFKVGKLNLVDLAGSERVRLTGATGRRLEESKKINQSLSALGNVIAALTDTKSRQHIPYRDSKLTRILEDSLGGNCVTTMMAMISPAMESYQESLSTLKFAHRAKSIKNQPHINEDLDQRGLLRKYEMEIKKLRGELQSKSQDVADKRRLLQLEELRRRAEADKTAALTALEERSREFMREKAEKRKLEQRLHSMSSQLIAGGQEQETTAAMRSALRTEHEKIHGEYVRKLEDLERERHVLSEDKSQIDRYKQLLLKQRDIMIALTARLNERDEMIMRLQEEVDAYDRHQRDLEDALDQKTASLIHLQRVALEQADSPDKRAELASTFGGDGGAEDGASAEGDGREDVFSASEGGGVQRQVMEKYLREKLEVMVQAEIHERINDFRKEMGGGGDEQLREEHGALRRLVGDLKAKLEAAEKRARGGGSERAERAEAEAKRLRDERDALSSERDALEARHERLRGEMASHVGEKSKLVGELEGQVAQLRQKLSADRGVRERLAQAEKRDGEREREVGELKSQLAERQRKVDLLKQFCSVNQKERAALRTIMEVKIKTLVDAAIDSIGGTSVADAATRERLSALRKIVNASVHAMKADEAGGGQGAEPLSAKQ